MFMIHAGFLAYEIGASRVKNALASGMKNILTLSVVIPTFYFFGWWIYNAFPGGLVPVDAAFALPWSTSMGPDVQDMGTGIFWAAFALFGATTGSIMSGAVIERIRLSAYLILTVLVGSVVWILAGAWGWHPDGWLLLDLGYHDVGASGVVHAVAGFFSLGVLINLGPRIGKFVNGKAMAIVPHNLPMALIGLMMIIVGFFGFLGGCIIYTGDTWMTIYNTPATLSAFAFNTLMGVAGGMIGAYLVTRDPFWMMSGALIGVISSAPALDLYYPGLAFLISFGGGCIMPKLNDILVGKFKIDDAVGAVAVHGFGGVWGLIMAGVFASGYPNVAGPEISFVGQLSSAVVFMILGFAPGYVLSLILKVVGLLRVTDKAELAGLDKAEVPVSAYPESTVPAAFTNDPASPTPAE
jgi:ammonia channel protein AmtB